MYATRTPIVGRTMTLGDLLQSLVHDRLPSRLLALLPLLLLPALALLIAGWWRTATPFLVAGFFGAWGWTDVWLERVDLDRPRHRTLLVRGVRGTAALCGVLSAGALIVVLLTRVLGAGVSCLGCGGCRPARDAMVVQTFRPLAPSYSRVRFYNVDRGHTTSRPVPAGVPT